MNIVYKVIFTQRIANNIKPYYYIGSKSNCIIKDGLIYDKDNKVYFGSSHYDEYDKIVKTDKCIVEILYIADTYSEALLFERDIQIENDVVASTEYFNLSIQQLTILPIQNMLRISIYMKVKLLDLNVIIHW